MKRGYTTDPDGKPSLGRLMIMISILVIVTGAYVGNDQLLDVGKYVLTTFLGWEARKYVGRAVDTTDGT